MGTIIIIIAVIIVIAVLVSKFGGSKDSKLMKHVEQMNKMMHPRGAKDIIQLRQFLSFILIGFDEDQIETISTRGYALYYLYRNSNPAADFWTTNDRLRAHFAGYEFKVDNNSITSIQKAFTDYINWQADVKMNGYKTYSAYQVEVFGPGLAPYRNEVVAKRKAEHKNRDRE